SAAPLYGISEFDYAGARPAWSILQGSLTRCGAPVGAARRWRPPQAPRARGHPEHRKRERMPEIASIAIVEPSTTTRETLRNVAQALDWVVVELEVQKYEQALVAFQDTQVDGVIIGLDDDTEKSLELVAELTQAHPQITLAVISGRPDVLVQAHRNGARY